MAQLYIGLPKDGKRLQSALNAESIYSWLIKDDEYQVTVFVDEQHAERARQVLDSLPDMYNLRHVDSARAALKRILGTTD